MVSSKSFLKFSALVLVACCQWTGLANGLVIPAVRPSRPKSLMVLLKDDPLVIRPYSRLFLRHMHHETSSVGSMSRRQDSAILQTSEGVPGTVSIMDPSRAFKLGSLVLASTENATTYENSTASSFVLNASNSTSTELLMVPVGGSASSSNNGTIPVTLQLPILDTSTDSLVAYCATMDDTPGVPTAATMEPCLDNGSGTNTTGAFVVHKVQAFTYEFSSGTITPQFQTTITNATELLARQEVPSSSSVSASTFSLSAAVASASSSTSLTVSSTSAIVVGSVASTAPTSSATSVASTPSSVAGSAASAATSSAPSAASSIAPTSATSAASTATSSVGNTAPSVMSAVLVFVPSVAAEVAPHDDIASQKNQTLLSSAGVNTTEIGSSAQPANGTVATQFSASSSTAAATSSAAAFAESQSISFPASATVTTGASLITTSSGAPGNAGSSSPAVSSSSTVPQVPSMIFSLLQSDPTSTDTGATSDMATPTPSAVTTIVTTLTVTETELAPTGSAAAATASSN